MGGNNGGEKGKGFQEHLQRRHGQNQKGVGLRMGGGDGWGGGSGGGGNGDNCTQTTIKRKNQRRLCYFLRLTLSGR